MLDSGGDGSLLLGRDAPEADALPVLQDLPPSQRGHLAVCLLLPPDPPLLPADGLLDRRLFRLRRLWDRLLPAREHGVRLQAQERAPSARGALDERFPSFAAEMDVVR